MIKYEEGVAVAKKIQALRYLGTESEEHDQTAGNIRKER